MPVCACKFSYLRRFQPFGNFFCPFPIYPPPIYTSPYHNTYIIYNREFFLRFSSALHQPSQYAASACAACCAGHRSALAFLYPWFRVFLAAVSFCPRSLFHLCFLPGEISVPRLRMAVQSLMMYIQRLRMAIQRLQTEILASSFRNIIWLFEEVWAAG